MATVARILLFFVVLACVPRLGFGDTNPQDAAALRSILSEWQNAPPSWGKSNDPCGYPWEGVSCTNSRVNSLILASMGIKGKLSADIGQLTALQTLDLSSNSELGGTLTPSIGNLKQLNTLILAQCSFSGNIPDELGNLTELTFLALNSNKFTGGIPASFGFLTNVLWLDVADNQLTGTLPLSTASTPGLDLLVKTNHFHFNKNQLSGNIPEQLFSSDMTLIHILFDSNKFNGTIPSSLGLVTSLEVLRLDNNNLEGPVPSNIKNLTRINELNLANNHLNGSLPDLTGMSSLNYVALSNNSFSPSLAPDWFTTIQSLTALVIESGGLFGELPSGLFGLPLLQEVLLSGNRFNGTLDLGNSVNPGLQLVDLRNNSIDRYTIGTNYNNTLLLYQNPLCNSSPSNSQPYCLLLGHQITSYSTSLSQCSTKSCVSAQQMVNPQSCSCAYPFQGTMTCRAPFFRDLTDAARFKSLETSLWTNLSLSPFFVSISNVHFDANDYLELHLALFPTGDAYFNRSEIIRLGNALSNQKYKPPDVFGPYAFGADFYPFTDISSSKSSSISTGVIAGIAVGCSIIVIGFVCVGIYALQQKKKAKRAAEQSRPFATWGSGGKDDGSAPQLKGARLFPFDEIKKCTNNFSLANEIGSGGYGKVYRGILSSGQMVAIKRAQQGSMQGALEFKTEIELLSRVHHKHLVDLVGFCYEQGEQMLVYEYIPNGTLRDNLIGRNGAQLDWRKRLKIALGSARGLTYLHELANPPIIHRDVKSTNILLDESLNAKVADFGLSKLISDSQKGHVSTQVKGTLGYLDPEYYMTQQLSEKSDVYSFGVVMLELITARQPIEKGKYIVREVRTAIDRHDDEFFGLREIVDPVIRNMEKLAGFRRFVELAMRCVEETAALRPTMNEVVKEIEMILQINGMDTQASSASSSATDLGNSHGPPRHPYYDHMQQRNEEGSGSFDYSGAYSAKIEPK